MAKHPHAELMKLYAEDAMSTAEPWNLWEFQQKDEATWYRLTSHPAWAHNCEYRRRPRMVEIDGVKFPIPTLTASDYSAKQDYFTISISHFGIAAVRVNCECISADRFDTLFKHGLIFKQSEDCERYIEALSELNNKIVSRFYEKSGKEN